MRRLLRHAAAVVIGASVVAGCTAGSGQGSPATPPASIPGGRPDSWGSLPTGVGDPGATSTANVQFTPQTVAITPAEVRQSLIGVSVDGSTYTFANSTGPLGRLAPGKVMLLESLDAATVTSVTRAGRTLIVTTSPATLPDLIQSGTINVNAAPDLSGAFMSSVGDNFQSDNPGNQTIAALARTSSPRVVLDAAIQPSHTFTGKSGNFSYSLTLTGQSDGLHMTGTVCYSLNKGPVSVSCGSLLSLKGDLDSVINYQSETALISFAGGHLTTGSFSLSGLSGKVNIKYEALRGDEPNINADPPVFKLPYSFEMPVCPPPTFCDGIPLYSKVELSLLVKMGLASKGALIQGGVTASLSGSASVGQNGSTVSGATSGFQITGQFLPGPALTAYSSVVEVATQVKIGFGLGVKSLNAMFYVSFVAAVGQETPSAVVGLVNPGQLCEDFSAAFTITGNAEAQLFKKNIPLLPAKTLYKKTASFKRPGC